MAITYDMMNENALAIEYYNKTLEVQKASLPSDHPSIALTYNNMGSFHHGRGNHAKALEYYEKSLCISRKTLPPTHRDLVRTENNIRKLNDDMKK
jgi:tetratricopeptide (TPR) repeat protein